VKALESRIVLLCLFLLVVSLTVLVPEVRAQTTSITNLHFPSRVILGTPAASEISVEYSVTFSGGRHGYSLAFAVWDSDKDDYAVGRGSSTPESCTTVDVNALCDIFNIKSSGQEQVRFALKLSLPGTYHLEAWAVFFDYGLINESWSRVEFTIVVDTMVQLTVTVPYGVAVSVDGATQQPGNAFLAVSPGTHQISVPATVDVASDERWKFDHWTDGQTQISRTENLQDDATFGTAYVKQYSLTLQSSQAAATGAGWYDEGVTATFSVVTPQPMSGLYGLLGGKYVFDHWSGDSAATAPTASLMMDKPATVKAEWRTDYTMPYIVIGAIAAAVAIVVLLLAMRKRRRPETATATGPAQPIPQASIAAPLPVTADKFCINCGAPLPAHATFCNKCGTKQ
jgi:hypothetical protein